MTKLAPVIAIWFAILCVPVSGEAYSIASRIGEGCHEKISLMAFKQFLKDFKVQRTLTVDKRWHRLIRIAAERAEMPHLNDTEAIILFSLLVGSRAPDTDGHSIADLNNLRNLHADPNPEGQYAHSLRASHDDYAKGNETALEAIRQTIRLQVVQVLQQLALPPEDQMGTAPFYFDFYGIVEVPVWLPAFTFGKVAHTVQDSFSHTIRNDATGLRTIVTIANYIDGLSSKYDEERDGLEHSHYTDQCGDETKDAVDAAKVATLDLLKALYLYHRKGDETGLRGFLDKWFILDPGCTRENQMCGNARWLKFY